MTSHSPLPDLDLNGLLKHHGEYLHQDALERREVQATRAHFALDHLRQKAGKLHDNPTDAANAEADIMGQIADRLEEGGERITSGIAPQGAGSPQVPVHQLESAQRELGEAREELDRVNGVQEQLRQSARDASNLRANLDVANATNTRLQQELDQALARNRELERSANQPNPLQGRVSELVAENLDLKSKLGQANADKAQAVSKQQELQQQLDAVRAEQEQQVAQPDSQSGEAPAAEADQSGEAPAAEADQSMVGGFNGEEHSPAASRRWRDRLPGHGRNQGGEA